VSTTETLASSRSVNALASLADSCHAMRSRLVALNGKLTKRATLAQLRIEQIETERATWVATQPNARVAAAPLEQIDGMMAVIAAARRDADDGLAYVLALQDRKVQEITRCDDALGRIARTENAREGSLLAPGAPPMWAPEARTLMSEDLRQRLREAVRDIVERARDYMAGEMARLPLQVVLFALTLMLMHLASSEAFKSNT